LAKLIRIDLSNILSRTVDTQPSHHESANDIDTFFQAGSEAQARNFYIFSENSDGTYSDAEIGQSLREFFLLFYYNRDAAEAGTPNSWIPRVHGSDTYSNYRGKPFLSIHS
jgi:hypothetical protein